MVSIIESIIEWLKSIGTLISNGFSNLGTIVNNVWSAIKDGFIALGDICSNIVSSVVNGFKSVLDWLLNFFESCYNFLVRVFVPKDNYFIDNFNSLNTDMSSKIGFDLSVLEDLKGTSSISTYSEPVFKQSFSVLGVPVSIDYSFITKIRGVTLGLCNGLMVIFLCWYNFKKIVWLIRGTGPVEGGGYSSYAWFKR